MEAIQWVVVGIRNINQSTNQRQAFGWSMTVCLSGVRVTWMSSHFQYGSNKMSGCRDNGWKPIYQSEGGILIRSVGLFTVLQDHRVTSKFSIWKRYNGWLQGPTWIGILASPKDHPRQVHVPSFKLITLNLFELCSGNWISLLWSLWPWKSRSRPQNEQATLGVYRKAIHHGSNW